MRKSLVSKIFTSLAREVGVRVNLDPDYGFAGQIVLPNGRKRYFRDTYFDINPLGASMIAADKDYAAYFMKKMGFPVTEGEKFYADDLCQLIHSKRDLEAATRYALKIGLPVFVKPNDAKQGEGVGKCFTKRDFLRAARFIFSRHQIMLVQKVVPGRDYRIVVLDGKVISAYERRPLSVIGDGHSDILELIARKHNDLRRVKIDPNDFRIKMKLARMKLKLKAILPKGQKIFLLDCANLSTGGEAIDVTNVISVGFKKIAVRLTREMNLRFCGVDIITTEPIETPQPTDYTILEINAAPGLDHYANLGRKQALLVRGLYKKVLEAFKRD